MSEQRLGKLTPERFEAIVLSRLGAPDAQVLVGPRHGVDVGVVRPAPGVAMALTTDPVFVVPAYGWERAAWFAVHILASDAATSGLPLRWMTVDLNLPAELDDEGLASSWEAYARTCGELGLAVVTGGRRYDVAIGTGARRLLSPRGRRSRRPRCSPPRSPSAWLPGWGRRWWRPRTRSLTP